MLIAGLLLLPVAAGCTSSKGGSASTTATITTTVTPSTNRAAGTVAPPASTAGALPTAGAHLAVQPATGSKRVDPKKPVTVTVTHGTLMAVTVKNAAGSVVSGALSADRTHWSSREVLGYDRTYTLTTTARGANGRTLQKSSQFTTVRPDNLTMPYLDTTGGLPIQNGGVYGVGMVVDVHFDEHIADRANAERALKVTTSPAVAGSWYWENDTDVHWRPRAFYRPGTKVTIAANVFGTEVGPGLYGQADKSTSFTIGAKHVSISDDKTHHVKVYFGNKLVRSMPTSMGKGGTVHVAGRAISYWTQPGTYTVIDHNNPKIMDSRTYGLPLDKGGYKEAIYWATRISTDGVFLHELKSTIPEQGHRDMSHGCLNLNTANSKWFYKTSRIGDVVEVKNTGGSPLQVWQNGDWTLSWSAWQAGSALH